VHCLAHKLQLALVVVPRKAKYVHQFFIHLTSIINIVVGSSKCNDEMQSAQTVKIESMIAYNKIEIVRRANQIATLQRAVDTRRSSHFQFVCNLIRMFGTTCSVFDTLKGGSQLFSTL
jgi:hypothetical protein